MLLVEIANFLLQSVAVILGVTLLGRAYMNYLGMPARNPLAQFVIALTDWLVRPLRRLLPAVGRFDSATLLAALLVAFLYMTLYFLLLGLAGLSGWPWSTLMLGVLIQLARWTLYLVLGLTLLHVVLSWINPHAPIAPAVAILVRPFLAPFQRALPLVGGIDMSPVVVILIVNVMLIVLARSGF
jgi:YggT family protein